MSSLSWLVSWETDFQERQVLIKPWSSVVCSECVCVIVSSRNEVDYCVFLSWAGFLSSEKCSDGTVHVKCTSSLCGEIENMSEAHQGGVKDDNDVGIAGEGKEGSGMDGWGLLSAFVWSLILFCSLYCFVLSEGDFLNFISTFKKKDKIDTVWHHCYRFYLIFFTFTNVHKRQFQILLDIFTDAVHFYFTWERPETRLQWSFN